MEAIQPGGEGMSQLVTPVQGGGMSLKARLQRSPVWVFVVYVSLVSFVVYTCMYGFRKPFTAA
jgi:hypothetical protein